MNGLISENPRVNVLLSAYNGEKYIREQLESIKNQTYDNIKLFIRDDGSKDGTVGMIRETFPDAVVWKGENIGYRRSFLALLEMVEEGAYWAFCDQDDYWLPEKIQWAVEWMEKQKEDIPLLFHSAFELRTHDMKMKLGEYGVLPRKVGFYNTITDSVYQGFSIVINGKLREHLLECDAEAEFAHDWMAGMIAAEFGDACMDHRISVLHRRTDESQSGMSLKKRLQWFCHTLRNESDITKTGREFIRRFGRNMKQEDYKLLLAFTGNKYNMRDTWTKITYPKRWRTDWPSEIAVRILMLLGKI